MKILLIGSGGREHALAVNILASPQLSELWICPGNAGTQLLAQKDTRIKHQNYKDSDVNALTKFAQDHAIDLVVVGPEIPLAEGIADSLNAVNIACFGPTQGAAQIESSKAFSKQLMHDLGIPTARFIVATEFSEAASHIESLTYPFVIKETGLAAGKGVYLPDTKEEGIGIAYRLLCAQNGAQDSIIIEERISGEEFSLMAFCDGKNVVLMPAAQDHKKVFAGDKGPNTGGMGAYAPAPVCTEVIADTVKERVLLPVINALEKRGTPFKGVLYAGMMLTDEGISVLEFNARFGDPETQVVLTLLESDLLSIMSACANGTLAQQPAPKWRSGYAACVILASKNYPFSSSPPTEITVSEKHPETTVFHAGTRLLANQNTLEANGGRVLAVTGYATQLSDALKKAYRQITAINFKGMHYRNDIGFRGVAKLAPSSYAASGVDIDCGNQAVKNITEAVKKTHNAQVLGSVGGFGGLFLADKLKAMNAPVLVSSIDGVGTKVKLAARYALAHGGNLASVGHDIVNHCIDDILVQGAQPLFFLDYFATAKLIPKQLEQVVSGMSLACQESGVVLIGGETAEMPGVYHQDAFDIAGCIIGAVERDQMLPQNTLHDGDILLGLPSASPHTNGYSLVRTIFSDDDLGIRPEGWSETVGEALLKPHRSYYKTLYPLLPEGKIKAMAHITGGGFFENIARILPPNLAATVDSTTWEVPALFNLIQTKGKVETKEMYRVFNMGIGMVLVVNRSDAKDLRQRLPDAKIIGSLSRADSASVSVVDGNGNPI